MDGKFVQRTEALLNEKSINPSTARPSVVQLNSEAADPTTVPVPPSPPAKKKKIKPQLSVPTSAGQISGNWQGLQKSLGLKDRPKRPARVSDVKSDVAVHEPAPEAEIPNAVADTFVKTKSFSGYGVFCEKIADFGQSETGLAFAA